ncbi:hypothetical protein P3L10_006999 [Capsicum annuum]
MGDNRIYFNQGFKSYDITRWTSNKVAWYDWVEKSRNMMRRVTLNEKALEWICFILTEASSDQKFQVRRWRYKDQMADFFGTRKYNSHGRYMSILSLKGEDRVVIIVPELEDMLVGKVWHLRFKVSLKVYHKVSLKVYHRRRYRYKARQMFQI